MIDYTQIILEWRRKRKFIEILFPELINHYKKEKIWKKN